MKRRLCRGKTHTTDHCADLPIREFDLESFPDFIQSSSPPRSVRVGIVGPQKTHVVVTLREVDLVHSSSAVTSRGHGTRSVLFWYLVLRVHIQRMNSKSWSSPLLRKRRWLYMAPRVQERRLRINYNARQLDRVMITGQESTR